MPLPHRGSMTAHSAAVAVAALVSNAVRRCPTPPNRMQSTHDVDELGRAIALVTLACQDLGCRVATQLGLALHRQFAAQKGREQGIFSPSVLAIVGKIVEETKEPLAWNSVLVLPWTAPFLDRLGDLAPWKLLSTPGVGYSAWSRYAASKSTHLAVMICAIKSRATAVDLAALGRWLQGSVVITAPIQQWRKRMRVFVERHCPFMIRSQCRKEWSRLENAVYSIASSSWPTNHLFQPALAAAVADALHESEVVSVVETVIIYKLRNERGLPYGAATTQARAIVCAGSEAMEQKGLPGELIRKVWRATIRAVASSFWVE